MFPIANESGRVIAFTARTLETGDKAGAKYINSPETPLYSKSLVLFNLDKARTAIRQLEFALLVEGQMDCISVFLRGIQNVIATSGTAFTEQQVAILKRHTSQVVVNFDPDAAGRTAAEKVAPLTEEGFSIRVAILEDGLDPDRFIRERGVEAYTAALRGAKRLDIFLIERALQLFPGSGAEQKVKAVNYLLPHIGRLREKLARDQFAADASQRLGIDSTVLREELHQAARLRRNRIETGTANPANGLSFDPSWASGIVGSDRETSRWLPIRSFAALQEGLASAAGKRDVYSPSRMSQVEKVLIRALAIADPENDAARSLVTRAIADETACFEHLGTFAALVALASRGSNNPEDVVEDEAQRALLAEALLGETKPPEEAEVQSAIQEIHERAIESRQRDLRALIAEAERRGDFAELAVLTQQKLDLDRALRQLHNQKPAER
jgi:DNA primase